MNSAVLALLALIGYVIAYFTYGKYISNKLFRLSDKNITPAHSQQDNVDFVPSKKTIVFGHHFTTIAGLGPIVGPAIGIIWGWLPAFLWVFLGSIFMGAVHDFTSLVVSARTNGKTIGELTGDIISPSAKFAFQFIVQLLLFIVLSVFAMIVSTLFYMYPESVLPVWLQIPIAIWLGRQLRRGKHVVLSTVIATVIMYATIVLGVQVPIVLPGSQVTVIVIWCLVLFTYVFFASTTPVQVLLQPRDFINSQQLLIAILLLVIGLVVAHPPITAPAINEQAFSPGSDVPPLAPLLFIVIACGAISGFHSLASSGTTVKQVDKERDTRFIGYGGMLTESFFSVLVIMSIAAGLGMGLMSNGTLLEGRDAYAHHYASWLSANGLGAKLSAFITGGANLLHAIGIPLKYGTAMISVFIVSFANTTIDSSARIQRLSLQEIVKSSRMTGSATLSNRYIATGIVVVVAAGMTFLKPGGQGAMLLWPLFGSLNQLMAALALGVVSVYLYIKGKPIIYTVLPMLAILVLTLWAMVENGMGFLRDGDYLLGALSVLILGLTLWLMIASVKALVNT